MDDIKILWADDEMDLLKPHVMFLQGRNYEVVTVLSGDEAIEACKKQSFDIIFLDENMPGMTGLEALETIKNIDPGVPVVMVTKSEEENIMDEAIGGNIADYLIKPVNPNQMLLSIKKNVQSREIRSRKVTSDYQSTFTQLSLEINDSMDWEDWMKVYEKLVFWELELDGTNNPMKEVLQMQQNEANHSFCKFISKNYVSWFTNRPEDKPMMSPDLFKDRIFPLLDKGEKVFLIVIDNLRYDQWRDIKTILSEYYSFDSEELYYSILPTATQYARNAIFSGLMPEQIKKMFPDYWVDEDEEESKNNYEDELLGTQIERFRKKYTHSYNKIFDTAAGGKLVEQIPNLLHNDINTIVLNFVDMLSHSRTESKTIRELASDEAAYRSLAISWFKHSSTIEIFKTLAEKNCKVIVTTDHGTIRVKNPIKVVGDRNTNTNLRYKVGKNLGYDRKEVFDINRPDQIALPSINVSSKYIFAYYNDFFAYPNNYNHYVNYYRDTFQHGGISMEEMIVPFVVMSPKK
ncbi:PglZ domain-containing protein [Saccharicrinis sp. FJH2]|uniref:T9SS response regulator signal transducer PorX n=1 Tax=Saccharicrinis sp. FJH65 TaxID=3344659 RepID=UPI0035F4AF69